MSGPSLRQSIGRVESRIIVQADSVGATAVLVEVVGARGPAFVFGEEGGISGCALNPEVAIAFCVSAYTEYRLLTFSILHASQREASVLAPRNTGTPSHVIGDDTSTSKSSSAG